MTVDLLRISRQATELLELTLVTGRPGSLRAEPGVMLATVPTPEFASKDEQHELGLAAVEVARAALGTAAFLCVSHTVAGSIVIGATDQHLGIDAERLSPARPRIAERILTPSELAGLGPSLAWLDVLRCFCIKEATYKILGEVDKDVLGFRGLQIEHPGAPSSRVHLIDGLRQVARAGSFIGADVIVAIAEVQQIAARYDDATAQAKRYDGS